MKTTKEMIAVMQAAQNDAEIEFCRHGFSKLDWVPRIASPAWNWVDNDYRVKPRAPREWWLNTYSTGEVFGYASADEADGRCGSDRLARVHVIEVLDDD